MPDVDIHRMSLDERRASILSLLERESSVQVSQLAKAFGISRVTARADLDALEQDGKLKRTHGGAVSLSRRLTVSVQDRRVNVNVEAKRAIAVRAASLVSDGESVILDSGTTALELARALSARSGLTIVTADLTIAEHVDASMPGCDVILLGGFLRKAHRYVTGPLTLAALQELRADRAFLCPGAFLPDCGFMTGYQSMAELKRALIGAAGWRCCLMDSSKVGASGLLRFAGPEDFEVVVMDEDPHAVVRQALKETQARLVVVR